MQFLLEAVIIGITGGLLGIITGFIFSYGIEKFSGIVTIITPFSIFLSLFVSVSVGLVFGILPAKRAAEHLGRSLDTLNLITLHLGNGASATAIRKGKSVDTSMGMTPMEGLVMGTRCGDIDPAIHFYLGRTMDRTNEELEKMLNQESGLKGICGVNDMREIIRRARDGDEHAQLAIDIYCYRIRKYIGAYSAVLGQVDAIVFTGGIGENAALIRKSCCNNLEGLGIVLDNQKNKTCTREPSEIQEEKSSVRILVIPTNEELEIARQTVETIQSQKK